MLGRLLPMYDFWVLLSTQELVFLCKHLFFHLLTILPQTYQIMSPFFCVPALMQCKYNLYLIPIQMSFKRCKLFYNSSILFYFTNFHKNIFQHYCVNILFESLYTCSIKLEEVIHDSNSLNIQFKI